MPHPILQNIAKHIHLVVTQKQIASYLGVTPEFLSSSGSLGLSEIVLQMQAQSMRERVEEITQEKFQSMACLNNRLLF